jgi:hypothetical protein
VIELRACIVLTSLLLQGRIGQDTLSTKSMIRQHETATRSSRRRFYGVYKGPGDLSGKLQYPRMSSFGSLSLYSLILTARGVRDRLHTCWQPGQGSI